MRKGCREGEGENDRPEMFPELALDVGEPGAEVAALREVEQLDVPLLQVAVVDQADGDAVVSLAPVEWVSGGHHRAFEGVLRA